VRETNERFWRVIAAALLGAMVTLMAAQGALAHAEPERANPPIGGTVSELPARLDVWFTEEVSEAELTVRAPDGTAISAGVAAIDLNDPERRHVTVALGPSRGPGEYVVEWRSVSASDGDAAEGVFRFVLAPGGTPAASPGASPAASPVASPGATPASGQIGQAVSATPAPTAPADEGEFDARAFGISVLAGLVAAAFIYLFWRLVRPKPTR
jgi:methionine-rich copper-binding protein CopC